MYKYFDFDLNVKLDSAQVGFDENGARNAEPANEAFDWKEDSTGSTHDITGKIQNPVIDPAAQGGNATVVTWSESTTTGNNGQQGGNEGGTGNNDPQTTLSIPHANVVSLPEVVTYAANSGSGTIDANYSFFYEGYTYISASNEAGTWYKVTDSAGRLYDPTGVNVTFT